jgi:hypothetical protein
MISERQVRAAKEVIELEIEAIFWSDEPTFEIPYEAITRAALEAAEREREMPSEASAASEPQRRDDDAR